MGQIAIGENGGERSCMHLNTHERDASALVQFTVESTITMVIVTPRYQAATRPITPIISYRFVRRDSRGPPPSRVKQIRLP